MNSVWRKLTNDQCWMVSCDVPLSQTLKAQKVAVYIRTPVRRRITNSVVEISLEGLRTVWAYGPDGRRFLTR